MLGSEASSETMARSRSPSPRGSTSSSTSYTAATTSPRVRTTFAPSGAASVTAGLRCPFALRLANATARYLVSDIATPPRSPGRQAPRTRKASLLGGLHSCGLYGRVLLVDEASHGSARRTDAGAASEGHGHP